MAIQRLGPSVIDKIFLTAVVVLLSCNVYYKTTRAILQFASRALAILMQRGMALCTQTSSVFHRWLPLVDTLQGLQFLIQIVMYAVKFLRRFTLGHA